jgi:hypothetical protein
MLPTVSFLWIVHGSFSPLNNIGSRRDSNLNVGNPLELYLVAVFVRQRIFNTEVSIPVVTFDSNLRLFRLVWMRRWDQLFNGAGDDGPWLFGDSRCVQILFAILADLDMRGSAISVSRLAGIVSLSSFLRLLWFIVS